MSRVELVWSPDDLLVDEAVDVRLAEVPSDAEILTFHAEGSGVPGLEEVLIAPSLFGPERAVIVREAERLSVAASKRLAELLTGDVVPARVVIVAVSDRPPQTLIKAVQPVAKVERLALPQRGELVKWVADRMRSRGLTPGKDAAAAFIETVGSHLRDLDQAIGQIAIRAGKKAKVDRRHVLAHFSGTSEQPVWALFDALSARDASRSFGVLRSLLDHGDDPIPILFALVSQVRYVLRAKGLVERTAGASDSDMAGALGVSAGRAAVLRRQAARLEWDWLLAVHDLCAEADVELKGGEDGAVLPPELVLERVVGRALAA